MVQANSNIVCSTMVRKFKHQNAKGVVSHLKHLKFVYYYHAIFWPRYVEVASQFRYSLRKLHLRTVSILEIWRMTTVELVW